MFLFLSAATLKRSTPGLPTLLQMAYPPAALGFRRHSLPGCALDRRRNDNANSAITAADGRGADSIWP